MVHRWRFEDPSDPNPDTRTWTFPINPNAMEPLFASRAIATAVTTALDGQALFFEGNPAPQQWTFSGDILDSSHYEGLRSWVQDRKRRVYLYDHFGRRITLQLVSFDPTPKRSVSKYWRHTYDIKALVIAVGAPTADNNGYIGGSLGTVDPTPGKITATFTALVTGLDVAFSAASSTDSTATITSYTWNFGDGGSGSGIAPSHTYAKPGTYAVTLICGDAGGGVGATTRTVTATAPVETPVTPPTPTPTAAPSVDFTVTSDGLHVITKAATA